MISSGLYNCVVNSENLAQVIAQVSAEHDSFHENELADYLGVEHKLLELLMARKRILRDGITKKIVEYLKRFRGYETLSDGLEDLYFKHTVDHTSSQLDEDIAKLLKMAQGQVSQLNLVAQDFPDIKFYKLENDDATHYIELARTLSLFMVKLGQYTDVEFISTEKFDYIIEQLTLMRIRIHDLKMP